LSCQEQWEQITDRTAWCGCCGRLRIGTYKDEEYINPEDGTPIKLTSTGYYCPESGHWTPGPVPSVYLRAQYGEPYTYKDPKVLSNAADPV
jgi:hypothetical protein